MKSFFYLFLIFTLFLSSCVNEKALPDTKQIPTLDLIFKGIYKDKPLVFAPGYTYEYFDGSIINFTKSEFFISHIELIDQDGKFVPIGSIYLVELQQHHTSLEKAIAGYKISLKIDHPGEYKGIKFGLGLSPDINKTSPSSYASDNILSNGDHYWGGWNSYIFSKTEGALENPNKSILFAYHTGFNESYRTVIINKGFSLQYDKISPVVVEIDHSKIFGNDTDYISIFDNNIVHDGSDFLIKFMNRFQNSFN